MIPATDKQLQLIKRMESFLTKEFKGNTVQDATEFITENMEEYQREREHAFDMIHNENNY